MSDEGEEDGEEVEEGDEVEEDGEEGDDDYESDDDVFEDDDELNTNMEIASVEAGKEMKGEFFHISSFGFLLILLLRSQV